MSRVGYWDWDHNQFPVYQYTGGYPFYAKDKAGVDAGLPDDPTFLLGNYRATLFAHASGAYELVTGERGWARLNHAGHNKGWNQSSVRISEGENKMSARETSCYCLVGGDDLAQIIKKQSFGVGYACYQYTLAEHLDVTKLISAKPSMELHTGNPSFLIQVTLQNNGASPLTVQYSEEILSHYMMMNDQDAVIPERRVQYRNRVHVDQEQQIVKADISCEPLKLLFFPERTGESYTHDIAPPVLFIKAISSSEVVSGTAARKTDLGDLLCADFETTLNPGEQRTIQFIVGWNFDRAEESIQEQIEDMLTDSKSQFQGELTGAYAHLWRQALPCLEDESDPVLRCEMLWNAYTLEAMATYSQYFRETYIPQGTVYAYHLGENASNRDHLQHALPLMYTNPKLAKSSIRYAMMHSSTDGEIKRQNIGFGYSDPGVYMESDEQIYMFMAVAEYLRITGEYAFLDERVYYYPVENGRSETVINLLVKHFIYLRDVVGRGRHGLIKMLNSDWSDSFFHPYSPNIYSGFAQSHLNTAMALSVLPAFIRELKEYAALAGPTSILEDLIEQAGEYYDEIYAAYMADMEGRTFSPRCYLCEDDEPMLKFGMDTLCIEPQPFLLQVESFPLERKKQLYHEIKTRVLDMEKHGARTREVPLWGSGNAEDGGIWFSHQGPLIIGIASFDKAEAVKLLKKLSFHRFAENYPDYWLGHWTFADVLESSLFNREGLYKGWLKDPFQAFCAHAHAWLLYCYYKVCREADETRH
ncbi:GH36-type glycosyl hydrolase domain-containing protein [Paenibacillus wynnii]|uniref:Glycosyl hydrolase 94 catalytic domain-containing protein n=1 Tax=Paenibacillus wynnii TaxID=268407 RepID=A0A098M828_9BACL|nr:hypothetical protein [Paenibacillus wynnii]KGE18729.1 hypothetical protein PWYN_04610 [Paenibacillus wynnii]